MSFMTLALALGRLEMGLVALVLLLAFCLGSFAVKNSDFWMHLAAGRDLVHGTYKPWTGEDPYAYTTQAPHATVFWVNHAWLFDGLLYVLYSLPSVGEPAVVILKALLAVALAAVLLQIRRPGQGLWIPAVFTGLALLAVSPRLLLQPACVSFLFLGLTLWLLQPRPSAQSGRGEGRDLPDRLWLLPPLFFLWVNLDAWFLLGPLTVALYLGGEILQGVLASAAEEQDATRRDRPTRLALVLLVGVVACLLNPHLVRAFTLPPELSFAQPVAELTQDREFATYFFSPLNSLYFSRNVGGNVAGVAFLPLALLGVASFLLPLLFPGRGRHKVHWWRVLIWLAFALLAAYRWHALPFFAVVAGPIAALNFQDWSACLREQAEAPLGWRRMLEREWPALLKGAALVVLLVVLDKVVSLVALHYSFPLYDRPTAYVVFASLLIGIFFFVVAPLVPYLDQLITSWPLLGRLLTVFAGIALLLVAWPGLLHASRQDADLALVQARWQDANLLRRVAWSVDADPSLVQAARRLRDLHSDRQISFERGFGVQPQVAHYCAWFCPEEKGFFDHRFLLFAQAAPDYLDLRGALNLEELTRADRDASPADSGPGEKSEAPGGQVPGNETPAGRQGAEQRQEKRMERLRQRFHDYQIDHVVLTGPDALSIVGPVQQLLTYPKEWVLVYLDGRTAIFSWKDPQNPAATTPAAEDEWRKLAYRPSHQAFGQVPADERIPEEPPPQPVAVPDWARYMAGPAPRSVASEEALFHQINFEATSPSWQQRAFRDWQGLYAAGVAGSSCPAPGPVGASTFLAYRVCMVDAYFPPELWPAGAAPKREARRRPAVDFLARRLVEETWVRNQDDGPPALALLGVRAARRAVAASPQDPLAYLRLEQAYYTLSQRTRERGWTSRMRPLALLRHVEMVTALQHALTIDPELAAAHGELAQLYLQFTAYSPPGGPGFLDLALKHRTEALKILQNRGPEFQELQTDYDKRVDALEKATKELEKVVQTQQNQYEVRAANINKPFPKAQMALNLGLADQAVTVLLESDVTEFGRPGAGARLQLELLLAIGRADDARGVLEDPRINLQDLEQGMETTRVGPLMEVPAYAWYEFLLKAACGDYPGADQQLEKIMTLTDLSPAVAQVLAGSLVEMPQHKPLAYMALVRQARDELIQKGGGAIFLRLQTRAELTVLRGLLALEVGDTERAEKLFREAHHMGFPPDRFLPFLRLLGAPSALHAAPLVLPIYYESLGPAFEFTARPMAIRYTELMEEAREPSTDKVQR
jgi:tetratricopeptide (TPR) repeat protein